MMPTPIQRLMAIWKTTLEACDTAGPSEKQPVGIKVWIPDAPSGKRLVQWPMEAITRHFESGDQTPRIACPDLAPERLSAWAIWSARSRTNEDALKKALAEDNNFLSRPVLGQQGVEITHCYPHAHYIEIQQGQVTILREDDSAPRSPEFLYAGERQTFPPGENTVSFKENTLLTIGSFPLHQKATRPLATDLELPTSQIRLTALCDVCKAIPWDELRTEDGPVHPHHDSVGHLIASSDTCKVCDMLVDAIIENEKQREQYAYPFKEAEKIPAGGSETLEPGKWTPSICIHGNWWSLNLQENPLP